MLNTARRYARFGARVAAGTAVSSLARSAGYYAANQVRRLVGAASKRTRGRVSRRSGGGSVLTSESRQAGSRYVGRNRGSRALIRFRNRVNRAMLLNVPLQVYQAVYKVQSTNITGSQQIESVALLDTSMTDQGDLFNIFKDAYAVTTTADMTNKKLFLKSAALNVALSIPLDATAAIIDVYEVETRKSYTETVATLAAAFIAEFTENTAVGGSISVNHPSVTPFSNPNFCSYFKVKRAKQILLKPGETATMQMRRKLGRYFDGNQMENVGSAYKGLTCGYIIMTRGNAANGTGAGYAATTVNLASNTQITYCIPPSNQTEGVGQNK